MLEFFGDTQMCRDTWFENHWIRESNDDKASFLEL